MSVGGVARSGLFLFVGSLIVAILGFTYWFLISIFGGAEVVGIGSSVYSLSVLISGIVCIGVPIGVQRFLGKSYGQKNIRELNTYFWSSFIFMIGICVLSVVAIWCLIILNLSFVGFSKGMLLMTGLMTSLSFYSVLSGLFASIVRTEYMAISYVAAAIIRCCSGVLLVYVGFGWVGAVIGLALESGSLVLLMTFFAIRTLKRLGGINVTVSFRAIRASARAGSVSWLPGVIATLGQQLSFLAVFGIQGGFVAGTYYIAYAIFGIVYMLPGSFMTILFPILSGLTEGSGEVAWRVLKLCLAFACPLTAFLMLYSTLPLSIMGPDYIAAAPVLSILAASTIPLTIGSAVSSLVYASGSYGKVLGIGLATNVPRVVLYFLLVPSYGGLGAALSFFAGSLAGLITAAFVSMRVHFKVSLKKIGVAVTTPFAVALISLLIGFSWLIGGMLILLTSIILYGRMGVVERNDLAEVARAFASEKTIARASERLSRILKIIYGE